MVRSDDQDYRRRLRRKNLTLAALLLGLVLLFFLITLVRMGSPA